MLAKRTASRTIAIVVLLGTSLLAACDWGAPAPSPISSTPGVPTTATPGPPGSIVKVGFAFAISGDNAANGTSQKAASQLAIDELNAIGGMQIAPLFVDTGGKPNQATDVFQAFINSDHVQAIIGPTLSSEALAADPIAQKASVPVLGVSNTAGGVTDIGDYFFRDSLDDAHVIKETVKEAKARLNLSKVAMLYAKDEPFSKSEADVFRTELQNNGLQILSEQTFSSSDTGYRTQLAAIKAENPEAIVVSALAKPAQAILQEARGDVGISTKITIIGGSGFNSAAVVQGAGEAAEGLIVGTGWSAGAVQPASRKFVQAYTARYGHAPDQLAAEAYAGVYIMYDAIKRANIKDKSLADARSAIRDALKGTSNLDTVLGSFSFTGKRDANYTPLVQVVENGEFALLKP